MKIEIWSDIACPFCYIGKRSFETALKQFRHRDQVEILFRSFELDPGAPKGSSVNTYEMLAKKYRTSLDQARRMTQSVAARGAQVGIKFDFEASIPTNLFDAHRLLHLAQRERRQSELAENFFAAYFTDGKDLSDHAVLQVLAEKALLPSQAVSATLLSDEFAAEVRRDEEMARELGINGVPAFVFNERTVVSGAQPVEAFMSALEEAW